MRKLDFADGRYHTPDARGRPCASTSGSGSSLSGHVPDGMVPVDSSRSLPFEPALLAPVEATHNASVRFWEVGGIASEGIERMAELRATSPRDAIIRDAIAGGQAQSLLLGPGINPVPGEASLELTVTRDFSYVTLVAMIAPSPDWFVGISARSFLESGDWPDELAFELFPYDAGTDDGETYNSLDDDTEPREPIFRIDNPPFETRDGKLDGNLHVRSNLMNWTRPLLVAL